jgi:anti-sigma factor RsiW
MTDRTDNVSNTAAPGCPDLSDLRCALDDAPTAERVTAHAAGCPRCTALLAEVRADAAVAAVALRLLPAPATVDAASAYRRFNTRVRNEGLTKTLDSHQGWTGGVMQRFWSSRGARSLTGVAAVFVLMMALALSPARGLANGVLDQFRVQKFAAITIPMDTLDQFKAGTQNMPDSEKQALQDEFGKLGTFETTLNMQSAHEVGSVDAASAAYGNLDVPSKLPNGFDAAPDAYVSDAGTATYTLNVGEADALVKRLGLPIYALPNAAQYPTLTFSVDVPQTAVLDYQNADGKHLLVGQMESPTLNIPEGIDMNALREQILQLPGLPTDLVAQLRQVKDWQHTLIIPVPSGASSSDVTMNGEPALLIEGNNGEGSAVVWQKGGVLYVVAGQVDRDAVMATADALQ